MRPTPFIAAALMLSFCLNAQDKASGLVLMSYNVRSGLGMDGIRRFDRPAAVIAGCHPYIAALQEIDRGTRRSGMADVLCELAMRTGMKAIFAPAIEFDGGQYGVGMLSTEEPLRTLSIPLPGREEPRVLLMAEFKDLIMCCTHLSLTPEDGLESVSAIDRALTEFVACAAGKGESKPVYLAGDWNAVPSSRTIKAMEEHFTIISDTTAFTYPAGIPDRTIDYIAVWKGTGTFRLTDPANPTSPAEANGQAGSTGPAGLTDMAIQAGPAVAANPAEAAIRIASDHRPVTVILQPAQRKPGGFGSN